MRIAYWGDAGWALGRIGRAFQKYLGADLYDWSKCHPFEKWRDYDVILVTTIFADADTGEFDPELYKRLFIISHFPVFHNPQFREVPCVRPGARYGGVSRETCQEMEKHGMTPVTWTPFGVDTDDFPVVYTPSGTIRRIGIVGNPESNEWYTKNKGLLMFRDICERVGADPVYIHGRVGTTDLYEGIDLFVCCSVLEAGPLGIFEAAACGVPVLTRRVGNAQRIRGIAMFDTVDDAVQRIQTWRLYPGALCEYARAVTQEVRTNWSMDQLIRATISSPSRANDV